MHGSPDTVGSRKEVRFESQFFSETAWFQKDVLFMSCASKKSMVCRDGGMSGIEMSQVFFKRIPVGLVESTSGISHPTSCSWQDYQSPGLGQLWHCLA